MMLRRRLSLILAAAALAGLWLEGCKRAEPPPQELPAAPAKQELPVEQTPVQSLYEEKPGVLYEKAVRSPTATPTPTRTPAPYSP
jgi:hypothetical protein